MFIINDHKFHVIFNVTANTIKERNTIGSAEGCDSDSFQGNATRMTARIRRIIDPTILGRADDKNDVILFFFKRYISI